MYSLERIRQTMAKYSDDKLLNIYKNELGGLTDDGKRALTDEIAKRGLNTENISAFTQTAPSEPIANSEPIAHLGARFGGQFVDGLVASAIVFIGILISGVFESIPELGLIGIALAWGYLMLSDGLKNGQSLGKRLMGIRVVTVADGEPCTFGGSFSRNILMVIPVINFLDMLAIFVTKDNRRLGDLNAKTKVIYEGVTKEEFLEWSENRFLPIKHK
jgi:uncharacterized RDD family membrane protein YckC